MTEYGELLVLMSQVLVVGGKRGSEGRTATVRVDRSKGHNGGRRSDIGGDRPGHQSHDDRE